MKRWYSDPILHNLAVVLLAHTLVHYKLLSRFVEDTDMSEFIDGTMSAIGYIATIIAAYLTRRRFKGK